MSKSFLYTRTGDDGFTSLVGGKRVPKYSLRLDSYGTVDEFSAFLSEIVADPKCSEDEKYHLLTIQNMLFNVGAYLATQPEGENETVAGLTSENIAEVESWIDRLDESLPPLRSFILPGGCQLAAKASVARTVCRRAERRILELASEEYVSPLVTSYINRLSDYLFVLGRYFNHCEGVAEIAWQK